MPVPREVPAAGPSRRQVLRLLGASGLAGAGLGLGACTGADREALAGVDLTRLRVDEGAVAGQGPRGPTERERRRRAVRAGSLAALSSYSDAAAVLPALAGRTGGTADLPAVLAVHQVHAEVLAGEVGPPATRPAGPPSTPPSTSPSTRGPFLPGVRPEDGGPSLTLAARPVAVLRAGADTAVAACTRERAAPDADVPLALLHARIAAARAAQADALSGGGPPDLTWPEVRAGTGAVAAPVLDALQALLAQEHRARWSFAVVQAWAVDREPDAGAARADHTRRAERLTDLVTALGASPVGAEATYPTDDGGTPVDGPETASALALRLADAVAAAAGVVLAAAVTAAVAGPGTGAGAHAGGRGGPGAEWAAWVQAAVGVLAEAERARWSWGGRPVPWPGA